MKDMLPTNTDIPLTTIQLSNQESNALTFRRLILTSLMTFVQIDSSRTTLFASLQTSFVSSLEVSVSHDLGALGDYEQ